MLSYHRFHTGRMRRLRADLERRRSSAPATVLRDQLKAFRKPKQAERQLSTPSLTRTTWSKEVNEMSTRLTHKPSSGKRNKSSELPTAPHPRRSRLLPTTRWVLACSEEDGVWTVSCLRSWKLRKRFKITALTAWSLVRNVQFAMKACATDLLRLSV